MIIGSISMLSLPFHGRLSGNDFGLFMVTMSLRKTQQDCKETLKEIEIKENGIFNPHFLLIQSTIKSWESGASKLIKHSTVSLLSQVIIVGKCWE
jgi:hypothetical protein